MSDSNSVPGMMFPTQKSMLAGDPRSSAIAEQANKNALQSSANKAMAGGKHRKKHRKHKGGANSSEIVVPQFTMSYTPAGGPGSNPNDQIKNSSQTSTQMAANSVYDTNATKMGGTRKHKNKRGGNPDWIWGCYSGGKKSKRRHTRRNKKTKSRRSRK